MGYVRFSWNSWQKQDLTFLCYSSPAAQVLSSWDSILGSVCIGCEATWALGKEKSSASTAIQTEHQALKPRSGILFPPNVESFPHPPGLWQVCHCMGGAPPHTVFEQMGPGCCWNQAQPIPHGLPGERDSSPAEINGSTRACLSAQRFCFPSHAASSAESLPS